MPRLLEGGDFRLIEGGTNKRLMESEAITRTTLPDWLYRRLGSGRWQRKAGDVVGPDWSSRGWQDTAGGPWATGDWS